MIRNLGRALTIVALAEAREADIHTDIDAFGGPGECHRDAARGEAARLRQARRHAEAVARRPWRIIEREARARGMAVGSGRWHNFSGRLEAHPCR